MLLSIHSGPEVARKSTVSCLAKDEDQLDRRQMLANPRGRDWTLEIISRFLSPIFAVPKSANQVVA